jgi:hypothetical protein
MKNLNDMIKDIDEERMRAKKFVNENDYHNGTAVNAVVRRYRKDLKELRKIIQEDHQLDGINNYNEVED